MRTFTKEKLNKTFIFYAAIVCISLRENCPYSEFFWSAFSRIRTEYGNLLCKSPYSVLMWENADQKKSKYGYLFTQCISLNLIAFLQDYILECSRPFINFDREIVSGAFKTISNIYDGAFS